ncbi:MAG: hypothetical protein VB858_01380, partial [Planctomycetaceae bacterium]
SLLFLPAAVTGENLVRYATGGYSTGTVGIRLPMADPYPLRSAGVFYGQPVFSRSSVVLSEIGVQWFKAGSVVCPRCLL